MSVLAAQDTGASERRPQMHIQIAEGINSVLIVEDEALVAMMMEDMLRELGATEIVTCPDLDSARSAAVSGDFDCAILDHHIRGGACDEIGDILTSRRIPFIFSTGSGTESICERHRDRPLIIKPFTDDDFKMLVLDTLAESRRPVLGERHGGPMPRVATVNSTE